MKIQSTGNVVTNGVKCMVYGQAGSGKTVLCATAPNPIILSAEAGLISLQWANLPYIQIDTVAELHEAYNWFASSKEALQYETCCLDSISEISEVILAQQKELNKDPRKAYGETQDQVLALIRAFRDLPGRNVYFSAKQEAIKDGITGAATYGPMLTGNKLAQHVPYFFDELFQLFVYVDPQTKQETRALRTKTDNQYVAKDRSGKLHDWEPPNLNEVFNKIIAPL